MGRQPLLINSPGLRLRHSLAGLGLRHSFFEGALLEQKHADNSAAFCLKEVIQEQVLLTSFKQKSTTNKVCDASVQVARPRIELGTS